MRRVRRSLAATSTRIPSRLVAVPARIWVSPTAPSRSSLARALGLPALSRNTIASSRSGSTPSPAARLDPRPPALDAAGRGEHPARALRVEHVAVPGGGALDELLLAVGFVGERVGLARVDRDRAEAGRAVLAGQGKAGQRRPGDEHEHEHEQAGTAQHPRKGVSRAYDCRRERSDDRPVRRQLARAAPSRGRRARIATLAERARLRLALGRRARRGAQPARGSRRRWSPTSRSSTRWWRSPTSLGTPSASCSAPA